MVIKALIFDLDGTLVQTEVLKAKSYARAAVELDKSLTENEVIDAFKDFVGLTRKEVALGLIKRFNLESAARTKMKEYHVHTPWQAYVDMRLDTYFKMISDPNILKEHLCPYNLGLLKWARGEGYPTGLGTMSHREEADRVLDVLGIRSEFDFIATIQDVEFRAGKRVNVLVTTERVVLTIIGAGFRGAGQDLVMPWDVPAID